MANPHRGEVDLVTGETTYKLRLSINAMAEIETLLGLSMGQVEQRMSAGSVLAFRGLLWGSLREFHPKVTLKEAGDLIEAVGLPMITERLTMALTLAFPEAQGAPGNPL